MHWTEIKINENINKTVKDTLEMRGDGLSLYALKRIDELEKENESLKKNIDFMSINLKKIKYF